MVSVDFKHPVSVPCMCTYQLLDPWVILCIWQVRFMRTSILLDPWVILCSWQVRFMRTSILLDPWVSLCSWQVRFMRTYNYPAGSLGDLVRLTGTVFMYTYINCWMLGWSCAVDGAALKSKNYVAGEWDEWFTFLVACQWVLACSLARFFGGCWQRFAFLPLMLG